MPRTILFGTAVIFLLFTCTRGGDFEGACTSEDMAEDGPYANIWKTCQIEVMDFRSDNMPIRTQFSDAMEICAAGCKCFSYNIQAIYFGEDIIGCSFFNFEAIIIADSLYFQLGQICSTIDCQCPRKNCRYKCDSIAEESCSNQILGTLGKETVPAAKKGAAVGTSDVPGSSVMGNKVSVSSDYSRSEASKTA